MSSPVPSAPVGTEPPPHLPHPPRPRWLGDVMLGLLVVAMPFLPSPVREFVPSGPVAWVAVFLPVLVLPWRRRWPLSALVVLVVLFGAAVVAGTLSPGIALAVAAATFHVVRVSSRRIGIILGGLAVVVIVGMSLPMSLGGVFEPRVLQSGLFVALAAAAGDGARSRHAYIAAITERAERAERTREAEAQRRVSEERLRIARDLHDVVAHQIAVISLNAGVASQAFDTKPEKAKQALTTIRGAARTVLGEIGDLMSVLRADGETGSDGPSPQPGLDRLDDLVAQYRDDGLDVQVRTEGDPGRVRGAVGLVAYRVLQEALTNAHKHGVEHRAHVLLAVADEEVTITVTNPMPAPAGPAGPDEESARLSSGLGLVGLRERVASVRGTIEAAPAPAGWRVSARLPLAKEEGR